LRKSIANIAKNISSLTRTLAETGGVMEERTKNSKKQNSNIEPVSTISVTCRKFGGGGGHPPLLPMPMISNVLAFFWCHCSL